MKIVPRQWTWTGTATLPLERGPCGEDRPVVWMARRPFEPQIYAKLFTLLSSEERARSNRFLRREDGERFVIGRGLLRCFVGAHLGVPGEQVAFSHGPFGKPQLARTSDEPPALHFNVSHSGELVLIAVSIRFPVGVDVEEVRPESEWAEIASDVVSPEDYARWYQLPFEARTRTFFQAWTRREAALKATGLGLSAVDRKSDLPSGIKYFELDLPPGYAGAVAVISPPRAAPLHASSGPCAYASTA